MTSWRQFLCDVRISCQCEMTDRPDTTNKLNIFFCHSSCTSYDDTETEVTDRQDTTKNNKIIVFVLSCELQNSVTVFTARLFVVAPVAALVNLDDGGSGDSSWCYVGVGLS